MNFRWAVFFALFAVLALASAQTPASSAAGAAPAAAGAAAKKPQASQAASGAAKALKSVAKKLEKAAAKSAADANPAGASNAVPDPLNLGATPPGMTGDLSTSSTTPPFEALHSDLTVGAYIPKKNQDTMETGLNKRIRSVEDLLNRMVWQLQRETSWANSVHDIIQNYQYKYVKVLANIKKHSGATNKLRKTLDSLKQAKLHELLERDLKKASNELAALASTSSETSEDEGSYAALKARAQLIQQDLEKMNQDKVHKVINEAQDGLKKAAEEAIPPPSDDLMKGLSAGEASKASS